MVQCEQTDEAEFKGAPPNVLRERNHPIQQVATHGCVHFRRGRSGPNRIGKGVSMDCPARRERKTMGSARLIGAARLLSVVAALVLLGGCASHYSSASYADPYGLFAGIWHGMVFPFALATNLVSWLLGIVGVSLFESIEIIGRPNTGLFFYYVGFALGLSSWLGGAGAGADN